MCAQAMNDETRVVSGRRVENVAGGVERRRASASAEVRVCVVDEEKEKPDGGDGPFRVVARRMDRGRCWGWSQGGGMEARSAHTPTMQTDGPCWLLRRPYNVFMCESVCGVATAKRACAAPAVPLPLLMVMMARRRQRGCDGARSASRRRAAPRS